MAQVIRVTFEGDMAWYTDLTANWEARRAPWNVAIVEVGEPYEAELPQ